MEFDNLAVTLNTIGEQVRDTYKAKLKGGNHISSGKLYNSIAYKLTVTENGCKLYFVAEDYWIYIENGRKAGKMPPIQAIQKWMLNKKIPGGIQVAYKIAKTISLEGTRPNPYLNQIKRENESDIRTEIMKALDKDVKIELNRIKEEAKSKMK